MPSFVAVYAPDNLAITGKRGVSLIALNDATWLRLKKPVDMNMLQHVPNALTRCNMDKGLRIVLFAAADRALIEVLLPVKQELVNRGSAE